MLLHAYGACALSSPPPHRCSKLQCAHFRRCLLKLATPGMPVGCLHGAKQLSHGPHSRRATTLGSRCVWSITPRQCSQQAASPAGLCQMVTCCPGWKHCLGQTEGDVVRFVVVITDTDLFTAVCGVESATEIVWMVVLRLWWWWRWWRWCRCGYELLHAATQPPGRPMQRCAHSSLSPYNGVGRAASAGAITATVQWVLRGVQSW
jgi:hypothetical protein